MSCCKGLSKMYLVGLNSVVGLAGALMLGASAYAFVEYSDFSELFTKTALIVGMASGGLVVVSCLIGCVGAMKQNKCLLSVYVIGMIVLVLAEMAAGIAILAYLGYMSDVNLEAVGKIDNAVTKTINDYELGAWQGCCLEKYPELYGAGADTKVQSCSSDKDGILVCYYAKDDADFEKVYVEWGKGTCEALKKIEMEDGEGIVGNPTEGKKSSCGGRAGDSAPDASARLAVAQQSQEAFQKNMNDWFRDHAQIFGIASCVLAGVQIIALIFTFVLLCSNRDEYSGLKGAQDGQTKRGNELAGTAAYGKPTEYV